MSFRTAFSGEEPAFLRALRSICANSAVKIFNLPSGAPMSHLRTADVDSNKPCHPEPLQRRGTCFYAKKMPLVFFQLALFYIHIFEFARLEHFAAVQTFHKFGVFFAGDYSYTGVLALGQIVRHRGRLDRAGYGHRFRTIAVPGPKCAEQTRAGIGRIFIGRMGSCQAQNSL